MIADAELNSRMASSITQLTAALTGLKSSKTIIGFSSLSQSVVRVELPKGADREKFAAIFAKAHGGKISSDKKTHVNINTTRFEIKHQKSNASTGVSTVGPATFGLLHEYIKDKDVLPYKLNLPTPKEPDELKFLVDFNKAIYSIGRPVSIKLGNKIYRDICGCNKVEGTPKADIVLVQKSGKALKEVAFISHKKEGGAAAFQQYGGVSNKYPIIYDDKLVTSFLDDMAAFIKHKYGKLSASEGFSVFRYVPDTAAGKALVARSLFGVKWAPGGAKGYDSVDALIQGPPKLVGKDSTYTLLAESVHPPTPDWPMRGKTDPFRAVFAGTFRNGRQFESKKYGSVQNVRAGIYPWAFIATRKGNEI